MQLSFSAEDEQFREEVAGWLQRNLTGEFEQLKFRGGPGDEHMFPQERKAWEQKLAEGGWTCVGWPRAYGGRGCSIEQQVIFFEEYARAGAPGRVGHIGEGLAGPTIIAFGSQAQKEKYLPGIVAGTELWCQGYSEPGAGSDLANVRTRARFDATRNQWLITGQKVWTSLAHESDYCFIIARTDPDSAAHQGLGFFLVKMDQPGIEIRPIQQITGTSEFNEVFFDDAECGADDIVGAPGEGWKVAMGTLAFERGVLTLGQQMAFQRELDHITSTARANGRWEDPVLRDRIVSLAIRVRIMRWNATRALRTDDNAQLPREAMINKLYWAELHRDMGEVAVDVLGAGALLTRYSAADEGDAGELEMSADHKLFFFSRSDTIYGGSNEIQRNLIGERALGLPREPR